ncbi:MAG: hypothetical protein QOJ23_3653 [Actinomycetota bacterium]|nr:hypothetical protein [Actinomycetota bacterium]MDQ1499301.1 hypothetical protein [Actinomycetota bacterium]
MLGRTLDCSQCEMPGADKVVPEPCGLRPGEPQELLKLRALAIRE